MNCNTVARTALGMAFFVLALPFSAPSHAQRMYRCGNVYQDRPCEDAQAGKELRHTGVAPTPLASASTDSQCRQRGLDSQKVVWARQSGALADKLMGEARTEEEQTLIADVYRLPRGSAPEVRAAIEAECVAAKKQLALANAAAMAAAMAAQGNKPTATPAARADSDAKTAGDQRSEDAVSRNVADSRKALCSSFNAQIEDIKKSQRGGGNVATMELLGQRLTDVNVEKRRAGC